MATKNSDTKWAMCVHSCWVAVWVLVLTAGCQGVPHRSCLHQANSNRFVAELTPDFDVAVGYCAFSEHAQSKTLPPTPEMKILTLLLPHFHFRSRWEGLGPRLTFNCEMSHIWLLNYTVNNSFLATCSS